VREGRERQKDWNVRVEPSSGNFVPPQLEVARNPEWMREVFQRHLRRVDGGEYSVQSCRVSFVRIRDASRALLEYNLRLRDPGTGREWDRVVTGVIYGRRRTESVWARLQRSDIPSVTIDGAPELVPFTYVPDLDMLVQAFPHDHRLPALAQLMVGPPIELEPLLRNRFGTGEWRVEGWSGEVVRYHPDRRATLRLTVLAREDQTGQQAQQRFFAKVYRDEREAEQAFEVVRNLWDRAGAGGPGFTVARPITYLCRLRALFQNEVPGPSLEDVLLREENPIPQVRQAARALVVLHLSDVPAPRRRSRANQLARLEDVRNLLRSAHPHLRRDIDEIVGAVVGGLEEVPLVPTHGELRAEHILLDGDRLTLLDLDKFVSADPMRDVASFLVNVGMPRPPFLRPNDRDRTIMMSFVDEYFAHAPEDWGAGLPSHYAIAALSRAAASYRKQERDWESGIQVFLEEARDSLWGRSW